MAGMPPRGRRVTSGSGVAEEVSRRSLACWTMVARASCASISAKCEPMQTRGPAPNVSVDMGFSSAANKGIPFVPVGGSFHANVFVSNSGGPTTGPVTVTVTLPVAGLTFDTGSLAAGCSASGQVMTCTLNTLAAGTPQSFSFTVNVATDTIPFNQ